MRRLHSRILGLGGVCGLPGSPLGEVFFKSLPAPRDVNRIKYERFLAEEDYVEREKSMRSSQKRVRLEAAIDALHAKQRTALRAEAVPAGSYPDTATTPPSTSTSPPQSPYRYVDLEVLENELERLTAQEANWVTPKEPFFNFVDGAAGHKHVVLLTAEGNLVTVGNNRYGQVGIPITGNAVIKAPASLAPGLRAAPSGSSAHSNSSGLPLEIGSAPQPAQGDEITETTPIYIESDYSVAAMETQEIHVGGRSALEISHSNPQPALDDVCGSKCAAQRGHVADTAGEDLGVPNKVVCGSNFTLVYRRNGSRVIAFGNNHVGQLGVGHKQPIDNAVGFGEWDLSAPCFSSSKELGSGDPITQQKQLPAVNGKLPIVEYITCGFNHSFAQLADGALLAFGSNTWGELGIGTTVSPMQPTRVEYFHNRGIKVVKVAAGNSFSLFLTAEGKVYGCGATNCGQLPANSFEPVIIPLVRAYAYSNPTAPIPDATDPLDATSNAQDPQHSFATSRQNPTKSGDPMRKLIRIRDIACVGDMAVFLSCKNELFVQGMMTDFGFSVPAPRFMEVDQTHVVSYFTRQLERQGKEQHSRNVKMESLKKILHPQMEHYDNQGDLLEGYPVGTLPSKATLYKAPESAKTANAKAPFDIVELVQGPTTLLVQYRNGCVAGLGSNTEGQLHFLSSNPRKQLRSQTGAKDKSQVSGGFAALGSLDGNVGDDDDRSRRRAVNIAESHSGCKLLPVLIGFRKRIIDDTVPKKFLSKLIPSSTFTMVIDHWNEFEISENSHPIELPPGASGNQSENSVLQSGSSSSSELRTRIPPPKRTATSSQTPEKRKPDARFAALFKNL